MVYLTDDLSLMLGLEEMTVLQIYLATEADVKKLLKKHEWKNCVSSKFTAKRLSKLLNREIETCSMERHISRNKATIIYFPTMIKFKDFAPRWVFEYRYLQFSVIELVPTVHMNNYEDNLPYLFVNE